MIRMRLASQAGSALVAATMVMTLILTLGLATLAMVDTQTEQSSRERTRESAFNWVEAVLNAQTFTVANAWPASSAQAVADCSWSGGAVSASGGVNACPEPGLVSTTFNGNVDAGLNPSWVTSVRDNSGSARCEDTPNSDCSYTWAEATSPSAPRWDQNADDLLWLRAEGTVNGDRRVLVALVRINNDPMTLPQGAIVAGSLGVKGGNKAFVYQNGSSITLRCPSATSTGCYSEQKPGVNVQGPGAKQFGYDDGGHVMTEDELDSMRTRAAGLNRYYGPGTCPTTAAGFTGTVVFIENANCTINHNWQINQPPAKPGILIVARGTLRFNGTADFWGLIYMYNGQEWGASDDTLFDGIGNGNIHGALFVDGAGRVDNQGSWTLQYDPNALNGVTAYGATGIVPNSFREVNP